MTRVNLGLIWRQGSCRSHQWCSFLPPLGEKPRRAERQLGAPRLSGQRLLLARARGRCLWPPPGDFERTPRSGTEGGGLREDTRRPVPGSDSQFLPACLPPPFHPGFLPSFQSVQLLSRQVRSRSRNRGWLRKTSVALKGVLLAVMLPVGSSLQIAARRGWRSAPGESGLQSWAWKPRARSGGGASGGVSCRILADVWRIPTQILSTPRIGVSTPSSSWS